MDKPNRSRVVGPAASSNGFEIGILPLCASEGNARIVLAGRGPTRPSATVQELLAVGVYF